MVHWDEMKLLILRSFVAHEGNLYDQFLALKKDNLIKEYDRELLAQTIKKKKKKISLYLLNPT